MKTSIFLGAFSVLALLACNSQTGAVSSKIAVGGVLITTSDVIAKSAEPLPASFVNNSSVRVLVTDPLVKFKTSVSLRNDVYGKKSPNGKPLVRVVVLNSKGEEVERQQRDGVEIDWEAHLLGADGDYDVKASLVNGDSVDERFESQIFRFRLDNSPPSLSSLSVLRENAEHTSRSISVQLKATDLSLAGCKGFVAPGVALDLQPLEIELKNPIVDSAKPTEHIFSATIEALPEDFPNTLIVRTSCTDIAGKKSEISEATSFNQPLFNIAASIDAPVVVPFEDASLATPQQRFALRTGTATGGVSTLVKLNLQLLDKTTGVVSAPQVVGREKSKIQVYLSNFEIASIADIEPATGSGKLIFMRKLFQDKLEAAVPSNLIGKQLLFVTATQIREADGKEVLLGGMPLSVYVEPNGKSFSYEWISDHQYVPAALQAPITAFVRIVPSSNVGTPLAAMPTVEYSKDNATWTSMPSENWHAVNGASNVFGFTVRYPFAQEEAFRVRVKGLSVAGNGSASAPSKNLVAPPAFSVASAPCSGFGMMLAKGSSFLCKRMESGLVKNYALIVSKNTGDSLLSVAPSVDCPFSSQRCVVLTDTRMGASFSQKLDATPFMQSSFVNGSQMTYLYGSLLPGEIVSHPTFGATIQAPGATCLASSPASVALKAPGLALQESAFDCD